MRARDRYRYFVSIPTRWLDNDVHGHVGSAVHYAYFDTAICRYLLLEAGVDIVQGAVAPFTVENACRYHRPFSFPEIIEVGLRVERLGRSSVRYEVALFGRAHDQPFAEGHFVDVFVDRAARVAVAIPTGIRRALERLIVDATPA